MTTIAASRPFAFVSRPAKRVGGAIRGWLPSGDTLPDASWQVRHRQIRIVLWAHAVGMTGYALLAMTLWDGPAHLVGETSLLAALALAAGWPGLGKRAASSIATVGLFTSSALLTHMTGGLIEAHFHFFVMVVVVSLYQAWHPFLLGLAFVVVHHGALGTLLGDQVFNHAAGVGKPWTWALVHAVFILGESVACLATWRVNEDALRRERDGRLLMEKAHHDLTRAQELSLVGSWDADFLTGKVVWSAQMYRIAGVDPSLEPSYETLLDNVHPDDRPRLEAEIGRILQDHAELDIEHRIIAADGRTLIVRARGRCVVADGQIIQILGTCQDVTEQRRLESEIEHRAFHDPLTNLGNRTLFIDRTTHALALRERSGAPLTALYLDLDDFKTVNDSLGHAAGDQMLTAVAERLRATVRPGDTVARLGGDEFAVLLESTDLEGAEQAAARILESLALPVPVGARSVAVRASVGIAVASGTCGTAEEILRDADVAMYAAKRQGKASYRVFTPDMLVSVVNRMELTAELRAAVAAEQFVVHYQPIIDLDTGRTLGVEALVRWEHPTRGTIPPLEFIPLAEETGLIVQIGEFVMRTATRDAQTMRAAAGETFTLSVNVSAEQFCTDLVAMVRQALHDSALPGDSLIVEITESSLIDQSHKVLEQLSALREIGVRVAIDDFGTGYSSMSYLRELPVDMLKIDRTFIKHVTEGGEQSALAEAIITLGRAFDLETVAEGIETPEQAHTLSGYGCHTGQGFLYSKPKPAAALIRELRGTARTSLAPAI